MSRSSPGDEPEHTDSQRLVIRPVRTLSGDGEVSTTLTVWCPRKAQALEVDTCADCERCHGWVLDPTDRDSFLMCNPGEEKRAMPTANEETPGPAVREIMSKGARVVRPDVSVEAAADLMIEMGISGVPVVDKEGRPIGVLSKSDLVRAMRDSGGDGEMERKERMTVGDVEVDLPPGFHVERLVKATVGELMTPIAFSVGEDTSVARAAALMAYEGVHRVPVTSEDGRVIGVLSSMDVLRWVAKEGGQ